MSLLFESVTCSRCDGTGKYSYNQMTGDRCFKCGGQREVLTKRGQAAQAFLNDLRLVPVESIQVGDKVLVEGAGPFPSRWVEVGTIEEPRVFTWSLDAAGNKIEGSEQWSIRFTPPDGDLNKSAGFPVGSKVRKAYTAEEKKAQQALALAYQATLTKTGAVRKAAR